MQESTKSLGFQVLFMQLKFESNCNKTNIIFNITIDNLEIYTIKMYVSTLYNIYIFFLLKIIFNLNWKMNKIK